MRRRVVPALVGLSAAAFAAWRRRAARERPAPLEHEPPAPALAEPPRQLAAPAATEPAPATVQPDRTAVEPDRAAPLTDAPTVDGPPAEPHDDEPGPPAEPPRAAPARTPSPDEPRFVSMPWTLAGGEADEAAPRDAQELPIRFTLLGERMELDRVDVRETESQVFVTVLARYEPPPAGARWVPYGVARDATIRLARPLGDRALVHAPDQLAELTGERGAD